MDKDMTAFKSPSETLQLRLLAAFAEYDAAVVSERIKLGIKRKKNSTKEVVS